MSTVHAASRVQYRRYLRARARVDRFCVAFQSARGWKRRRLLGVAWTRATQRLSDATAELVATSATPGKD